MPNTNLFLIYPENNQPITDNEAIALEHNRRLLLDAFVAWGYKYTIFPIVDYIETLLTARDKQLVDQTYAITDRASGRTLGIRADITPQAVKIDAMQSANTNRFCYSGLTLQSKPSSWQPNGQTVQIGAELFGANSISGNIEIMQLLIQSMHLLGIKQATLDLGHIGLYSILANYLELDKEQEDNLFELLQYKKITELTELLHQLNINANTKELLLNLVSTYGNGDETIAKIKSILDKTDAKLAQQLTAIIVDIEQVHTSIINFSKLLGMQIEVHIDLCELRGYQYKTGIVFALYHQDCSNPIALGGSYNRSADDNTVGLKARTATGFSCNLLTLTRLQQQLKINQKQQSSVVVAPNANTIASSKKQTELELEIMKLRTSMTVIYHQQNDSILVYAKSIGANKILVREQDKWQLQDI